jgi:hypothetical protein
MSHWCVSLGVEPDSINSLTEVVLSGQEATVSQVRTICRLMITAASAILNQGNMAYSTAPYNPEVASRFPWPTRGRKQRFLEWQERI